MNALKRSGRRLKLVFLGAPGAGKGTQAKILSERLGLVHIASGDLFRQAAESGTELGKLAKSYMEKGLLVPDEVTIKLILEQLSHLDDRGFILDGFPRTRAQAEALEKSVGIDRAIYLEVPKEELIQRLSSRWICQNCQTPYNLLSHPPKVAGRCDLCGGKLYQREDDKEETVRKRIEVYLEETAPLLDFYARRGKLIEVDGGKRVEEVAADLLQTLEKL